MTTDTLLGVGFLALAAGLAAELTRSPADGWLLTASVPAVRYIDQLMEPG
jgi:hypothetical protein